MPSTHPISVLILTKDEEVNIAAALDSVHFSDDVVVFDSYSTDRTLEIAGAYPNVTVYQRNFDNWSAHQNWAVRNIPFRHPWVLYIDADERVEPELAQELQEKGDPASTLSAYRMRRRDMFMGRWLKHAQLYPTWLIRFFRPGKMRYERLVNPTAIVDGAVADLQGHLIHYPFSKGVDQWFQRHNAYSSFEAVELRKVLEGRRRPWRDLFSPDHNDRRSAMKDIFYRLPCRPQIKWLYYMVIRRAWLDGRPGMIYAKMTYLYEYMITVKARQLRIERDES
jgi:glycosyltransferase involved in cell wall biosynthesis